SVFYWLCFKDRQPSMTVEKSIEVLKIKSGISALKTKGIKKLNKVRLSPNSNPPRISAFATRLFPLTYRFSQIITQATTKPVNIHHTIVSSRLLSKEEQISNIKY